MNDFFLDMAFSVLIAVLKKYIAPGGSGSSQWKAAFLKLFKLIAQAYGDDPAFKNVAAAVK